LLLSGVIILLQTAYFAVSSRVIVVVTVPVLTGRGLQTTVGTVVGSVVGKSVGIAVGIVVGISVGNVVGSSVGIDVGTEVGIEDTTGDGEIPGSA